MKLLPLFLFFSILSADPWGKDAELAKPPVAVPTKGKTLGIKIATALIGFHQEYIAKADGPRSHFYPSSSQYTKEAIQKYGFFYGYLLGCDRLMRENEEAWIYEKYEGKYNLLKYDPVK